MAAALVLPTRASPANPPAGTVTIYADADGDLHVLESDGTDTQLGGGGGGPVNSTDIQFAASSRILGRTTAGAGAGEELTGAQVAAIVAAATTSARGVVELATSAETEAGTDADRAVTPSAGAATFPKKSMLTTTGDLPYASGASTWARLGIGSEGQVLAVVGGVPAWVAASALAVGLILGDTPGGVAEGLLLDTDYSLVLT